MTILYLLSWKLFKTFLVSPQNEEIKDKADLTDAKDIQNLLEKIDKVISTSIDLFSILQASLVQGCKSSLQLPT